MAIKGVVDDGPYGPPLPPPQKFPFYCILQSFDPVFLADQLLGYVLEAR